MAGFFTFMIIQTQNTGHLLSGYSVKSNSDKTSGRQINTGGKSFQLTSALFWGFMVSCLR